MQYYALAQWEERAVRHAASGQHKAISRHVLDKIVVTRCSEQERGWVPERGRESWLDLMREV